MSYWALATLHFLDLRHFKYPRYPSNAVIRLKLVIGATNDPKHAFADR